MAVAVKLLVNAGIGFGAAVALANGLAQPVIVCLTVYVPGVFTVIDEVVAPLLQNNVPVNPVAVNTELPQLFTTVTPGATGVELTVSIAALEFTVPPLFVQTARY